MMDKKLQELREQIDLVDEKILSCLNERMELVKKVGELKQENNALIYRPEREKAIVNRLKSLNNGLLKQDAIESIYQEIFAVSRNLEKMQSVAFLGPIGTYSHQAATHKFGAMSRYYPLANIEDVFKDVQNKNVDFGVVPIENNTEGAVGVSLDCLAKYKDIKIFAEFYEEIHHSLVSNEEDLKGIKKIYSHPQGYNQCLDFLKHHNLENVEFVPAKSTAAAAFLASSEKGSAAICSKIAAKIYNLPILFECIEDNALNKTRFLVISLSSSPYSSNSKTSIMLDTTHEPGSLANILMEFKNHNINLVKIESRPLKTGDFKSSFFIDFIGHIEDENVKTLLGKIGNVTHLGSYLLESN